MHMARRFDWCSPIFPMRVTTRRKIARSWKPVSAFGLLLLYLLYKLLSNGVAEVTLPHGVDISHFASFEPDVTTRFPRGSANSSLIPRIIHQTWKDTVVPPKFVKNIKSFVIKNPSWKYYFWTDENSRTLISRHFPSLLPVWDNYVYSYHHRLRRFNIIRYVIMYVYGGVFVDLDTINYLPLDDVISGHACILSPEPFEHVLVNHVPFTITNAVMMCAPKHPYFKYVLDNINKYEHLSHSFDSAGPGFFTTMFMMYHKIVRQTDDAVEGKEISKGYVNEPLFYREYLSSSVIVNNSVYVSNSHYLTGSGDASYHGFFRDTCAKFEDLHPIHKRACVHIKRQGFQGAKSRCMYIKHLWQNNWYGWANFYNYLNIYTYIFGTDIRKIVPHCGILSS